MKGKFLNAKNAVIGIISCALIGASATGIAVFLKDRGETEAAQQQGMVENLPVTGNDSEGNQVEGNVSDENVIVPENQVPAEDENSQEGETSENENTESPETTTGTILGGTTPSSNEIIEGITETTVLAEKKVFEDLKLSWTSIAIPAMTLNMGIYKPELQIEKNAIQIIRNEDGNIIEVDPENKPRVRTGDIIIFKIEVSNIGNYKATNVVVTDSLDVIFNGNNVKNGDALVTIETLESGKKATLKVGYVVTENDVNAVKFIDNEKVEKDIYNVAYATDGKTTVQDDDNMPVNPDLTIEVNKVWLDAEDQDGKRPEKITVELLKNEEQTGIMAQITPDEEEKWKYIFDKLPKYDENNTEITYTVQEIEIDGYNAEYTMSENVVYIYNSYTPETIELSGKKIWDDNENQDGVRPDSVKISLIMEIENIQIPDTFKNIFQKTLTLSEQNEWKWEVKDLPKYYNGNEINYTIKEVGETDGKIAGKNGKEYTVTYDGLNVINKYIPETIELAGKKTWDDNNNQDGVRPNSITIELFKTVGNKTTSMGEQYKRVLTGNVVDYSWEALPKYENGMEIIYTVKEVGEIDGKIAGKNGKEYTVTYDVLNVTNTYIPEKVTVTVTKKWEDNENEKGKRPEKIIVNLLADESIIDTQEITATNNWTYTFQELDKYKNGAIISYTVTEEPITDYAPTYSQEQANGNNITLNIINTYNQDIEGTITTIQETALPLDVTFILDISSSMLTTTDANGTTRAQLMVEATNEAIKKLMANNESNRVSIVLFNSEVKQLIELNHYEADRYLSYVPVSGDVNVGARVEFVGGQSANIYTSKYDSSNADTCGAAYCGTYTQGGIKKATEILANNANKINRKPVMILLTDGNPTHYDIGTTYADWQTKKPNEPNGSALDKYGKERFITAEYYAYTMKTMQNSYEKLTELYGRCEIYTVGINMEGSMAKVLLEPTQTNISLLKDTDNIAETVHNTTNGTIDGTYSQKTDKGVYLKGAEYYRYQSNKLQKLLANDPTHITNNSYVKKAYTQSTANDIASNFAAIVNLITETNTITITAESYGKDRKIELDGFNESNNNEFSLNVTKLGETTPLINTNTISTAMEQGFITKNTETGKYYLDLSATTGKVSVTLKYHK